jgi:hypothetical protein
MSKLAKGFVPVSLFIITIMGVGCTITPYAREVKKKPNGGVVALRSGYTPEDRSKADSIMRANCAGKEVKITEEGEVTVGTRTNSQGNTTLDPKVQHGGFVGTPGSTLNNNTISETHDITEWHISYDCAAHDEIKTNKKKKN